MIEFGLLLNWQLDHISIGHDSVQIIGDLIDMLRASHVQHYDSCLYTLVSSTRGESFQQITFR